MGNSKERFYGRTDRTNNRITYRICKHTDDKGNVGLGYGEGMGITNVPLRLHPFPDRGSMAEVPGRGSQP